MAIDKIQVYLSMGEIKSYCDYLEKELSQKEIADKIRAEVEQIRLYLVECQ